MTSPAQVSIYDFGTWEPVLRLLRKGNPTVLDAPGGQVSGYIGLGFWGVPFHGGRDPVDCARALESLELDDTAQSVIASLTEAGAPETVVDFLRITNAGSWEEQYDAVGRVRAVLAEAGMSMILFKAQISPQGHARLSLFAPPPTMEPYIGDGGYPGTVVRHAEALPEPARRLPDPNSGALHHPSADLALLERVLRERLPGTTGASEEEIAAAEARLGLPLPDELRTLYRTVRETGWPESDEDWEDADDRVVVPLGELLHPLDNVRIGDAASRERSWFHLAQKAVITPPEAAVQQLVGSPGWIVFGDDHGNQQYAIDMTPGPRGHLGQVISLPYNEDTRAYLVAHSLTDFVQRQYAEDSAFRDESPVIARVYQAGQQGIEAIAHPDLEVLTIRTRLARPWEGAPLSLEPLARCPKLRTLWADPGTLADPLEVGQLAALEYLELGLEDWRTLLDAKALPGGLLAANVTVPLTPSPEPLPDPAAYVAVANEIISLWNGPKITETVIEGQLA